jgi:uncharacterized protein (TIGR00251 family)
MSHWYRWDGEDLLLSLRVQPRASRDELAEPLGDALKVRITAPPVDGKANTHLTDFLARLFGVAKSDVVLETGPSSRTKRIRVRKPRQLPEIVTPI